jgi:RHH-type proline utilization regulon transcriptional repressor/proline dehydrogenase/delta 1-pyrroline-5-carboxylate dehydrogenase
MEPTTHLARRATELAAVLLEESRRHLRGADARALAQVARMMDDPLGKAATLALCDRVFRPGTAAGAARQLTGITRDLGVPRYLGPLDRALFAAGTLAAPLLPWLVMPQVERRLRRETGNVILPAEPGPLARHIDRRGHQGVRLNLNRLGEAILGEDEAERRLAANLALLADPKVGYISVKVSSICSQVSSLGFERSLADIQARLRELYRACLRHSPPKFVNLDMEEYRDLELTTEAFLRTLSEPEFRSLPAGIVLQAYLPDAHPVQRCLTEWAQARVAAGGAPIKLRLVKGANLAMERVEAELHGWEQAPYLSKEEADANFRRMLLWAADPARVAAVRLGVGSHNLFDLALALVLREERQLGTGLEIEMLEGMAPHQAEAVRARAGGLLLYAPVVPRDDFGSAVAYLIRRLDENTTEGNFLRDLFSLEPGSPAWERQKSAFLVAFAAPAPAEGPRRRQDRDQPEPSDADAPFANAADTDWSLPANRAWIAGHLERLLAAEIRVPLRVAGIDDDKGLAGEGRDPSRPAVVAYRHAVADDADVTRALDAASAAVGSTADADLRAALLRAADLLERRRGELVAAMVLDGGKTAAEADAELSEAVDFAAYYARAFDNAAAWAGARRSPLGVVTVTPPWNFPFAIPLGGVAAALRAGNAVLLKPAPEAVLCGRLLCEVLWEAGIGGDLLHFVPAPDNAVGRRLVEDPRVAAVILTGASATAELFLSWRPDLRLLAETSGKNALIVTPAADRDLAIKDAVRSAFGHAGQKCSACSLLILVGGLADDPAFLRQLRDAAASLRVGSAWDPATSVPPLIREPDDTLRRGLTRLDPGESWLLEPRQDPSNRNLWSPGIRLGVTPDSWFFGAECFGPVLGVVRARDLDEAIAIANRPSYGLTGGIHSLDPREVARWLDRAEVGNAYVNRPITGAIVRRQPFGGWKRSAYGPGAKAGGPHYVAALCRWEDDPSADIVSLHSAADRAAHAKVHGEDAEKTHFALSLPAFLKPEDPSGLAAESNVLRRIQPGDRTQPYRRALRLSAGADAAECRRALKVVLAMPHVWVVSVDRSHDPYLIEEAAKVAGFCEVQDELEFAEILKPDSRVRVVGHAGLALREAARLNGSTLFEGPVTRCPRLEFHPYYLEQAVSVTRHRHGNPMPDPRDPAARGGWERAGLIRPGA